MHENFLTPCGLKIRSDLSFFISVLRGEYKFILMMKYVFAVRDRVGKGGVMNNANH